LSDKSIVQIKDRTISVQLTGSTLSLPNVDLPEPLISWLEQGRLAIYRQLLADPDRVDFFHHHLPVLVTQAPDSPFPFNCGNKGVGFLPRAEELPHYIQLYREAIEASKGIPWRRSLPDRIAVARSFHENRAAIDFRCLTSMEIFQRRTFRNLRSYPLAGLLFTGSLPEYRSFQLNCAVEIVDRDDPRFTFIKLSRRLFEFDAFHIAQPEIRYGYIFWLSEIIDKTPHRVAEPAEAGVSGAAPQLPWDDEALAALQAMPAWVRSLVKTRIERYGAERGFAAVTASLLTEARKVLRQ
jgi:hypothetical protein